MASDSQVQANRQNAKHSTGAKTPEGKARVSKNALKHGLLSKEVVLTVDEAKESSDDFVSFMQQIVNDLQPKGALEEMLVDRIASTYWRMRRTIMYEKGELSKKLNGLTIRQKLNHKKVSIQHDEMPIAYEFVGDRLMNSMSATRVKERLEEMKNIVESRGFLGEVEIEEYTNIMNLYKDKETYALLLYVNKIAKGEVKDNDASKGKEAIIEFLTRDIEVAQLAIPLAEIFEKTGDESERLSLSIPSTEIVDKANRYETMLENQLYKAINQLIKLQTLRKGGKVTQISSAEMESIEQ